MSETGFGSLTYTPSLTSKDLGFGSPVSTSNVGREMGFGSPFDPALLPFSIQGEAVKIGDDGGVLLHIFGAWDLEFDSIVPSYAGAFKVSFINQATNQITLALGGRASNKNECFTNLKQDRVEAYVPPLKRGTYDIKLEWGTNNQALITSAFQVIPRNKVQETYELRKLLPNFYKVGSREENKDVVNEAPVYKPLEALTRSIGQQIAFFSGRAMTVSTSTYSLNDQSLNVESTLSFKSSGDLKVNGYTLSYTGLTNTSFTGVSFSSEQVLSISKGAVVVQC